MKGMINMTQICIFLLFTTCGATVGIFCSGLLSKRCNSLNSVSDMLREMEIYIRYNRLQLSEIFRKVGNEKCFFVTEQLISSAANGKCFRQEWNNCVLGLEYLKPDDKNVLYSLGDSIGKSDTEGQVAVIEAAQSRLSACIEDAEDARRRKGKLYRTLGILIGAAAGIIAV